MPQDSILRFDARSTISGLNTCVNVFHVLLGPTPTLAEVNAILAHFKTFYDAIGAYRVPPTSVTIGSRVTHFPISYWTKPTFKPDGSVDKPGEFNTAPSILAATTLTSTTGTGSGGVPPQLAICVSWKTARAGRSYRGRTYLGNMGGSALNGAFVQATAVSTINSAAQALITNVAGTAVASGVPDLCVWSPTKGEATEVISGTTDSTWDTMRSRVK